MNFATVFKYLINPNRDVMEKKLTIMLLSFLLCVGNAMA